MSHCALVRVDAPQPGLGRSFRTTPVLRQTLDQKQFVTRRASTHALPPSFGLRSFLSADPFCFCRLPPEVNNKNSRIRRNGGFQVLVTSKGKATTTKELIESSVGVLIEALEAGQSEVLTAYLSAMAKFHYYSFGNVLLIAMQKPGATRVAGIYAWNQLGRRVKRGEKGIMILAPLVGGRRKKGEEQNESDAEQTDANGQLIGFRPVYVWDVLQTEGKDLPQLDEVTGNPDEQLPRLIEFVQAQGIKLEYSEKIAPARGLSYGGLIQLLPNLTAAEEFSTLVHELAHEMVHKAERRALTSKTVKETEAESVAFVVAKAIGLETGTASADYIQLYRGDAKLLQESLEVVQRTARSPRIQQSGGAAVKTVCSRSPIHSAARLVRAAVAFWLFQESTRGGYPLIGDFQTMTISLHSGRLLESRSSPTPIGHIREPTRCLFHSEPDRWVESGLGYFVHCKGNQHLRSARLRPASQFHPIEMKCLLGRIVRAPGPVRM